MFPLQRTGTHLVVGRRPTNTTLTYFQPLQKLIGLSIFLELLDKDTKGTELRDHQHTPIFLEQCNALDILGKKK
jgi:hypothetical protein